MEGNNHNITQIRFIHLETNITYKVFKHIKYFYLHVTARYDPCRSPENPLICGPGL